MKVIDTAGLQIVSKIIKESISNQKDTLFFREKGNQKY